ncbi:MAG: hypothetical protein EA425_02550 [Puniceicoccaceae bacterium]|nr:MAG: hypothetical protein EA425_02550 [Puniceicoccaceae bacterium]
MNHPIASVSKPQATLALLLSLCLLLLAAPVQLAAGIISTSDALALETNPAREAVDAWLQRDEVAKQLVVHGVSPEMARARAAAMSDEEIEQMAAAIEDLPAGGSIIAILGITLLVLIILHFTGAVKIFR